MFPYEFATGRKSDEKPMLDLRGTEMSWELFFFCRSNRPSGVNKCVGR